MFGFVSKKEFKKLQNELNSLNREFEYFKNNVKTKLCNHNNTVFNYDGQYNYILDCFDNYYNEQCRDCGLKLRAFKNHKEWQLAKAEKLEKEAQDIKNKLREEENKDENN